MSANPPIRGIPTHESDSPSLLIQRYLSSLPPTFSPDIRLYSQSAHPSRFRSQSRQPQHQPDINRILRSPPPSRTGHQSTLSHGNHPQSSVQGDKLVPVENKQPSTRKRLLADIGDEATPDISKSIRRSKGQDVSKGSKGLRGHRVQGAPLRRETSRIQHEENKEDTERREARKVRRREKAAILDPSPPTSPPRHPSLINVDFNREARSSKHNGQTGSEVGRTKNKMDTFRHCNVRKGRRSGVFDERDIIRKYKPVNIFPNTGRLTLGTKEGFLGLGKSSERIILPGARNESITGKGSRWDRYGGINRAEYAPLHGHRTPPLKSKCNDELHQDFSRQLDRYRYHSQGNAGSRASNLSYSRLPAPGITNSTSWPTWSSDGQRNVPPLRHDSGRQQATGPPVSAPEEGAGLIREDRLDYQRGGEEIDAIAGRRAWRWHTYHPIARILEANDRRDDASFSSQVPHLGIRSLDPQNYPVHKQRSYALPQHQVRTRLQSAAHYNLYQQNDFPPHQRSSNIAPFDLYNRLPHPTPLSNPRPVQPALPYPSSSLFGFPRQIHSTSDNLPSDQPFFDRATVSREHSSWRYPKSPDRTFFIKASSSEQGPGDDTFGKEIPDRSTLEDFDRRRGPGSVFHDGGSVFGIPPQSIPTPKDTNQNGYGTARALPRGQSDSLGSVFSLSQLAAYQTPPPTNSGHQQASIQDTLIGEGGFGDSF